MHGPLNVKKKKSIPFLPHTPSWRAYEQLSLLLLL